jgi:hypothetical protein
MHMRINNIVLNLILLLSDHSYVCASFDFVVVGSTAICAQDNKDCQKLVSWKMKINQLCAEHVE